MQYCRNDSNFLNYQRHCYNTTIHQALNTLNCNCNKLETKLKPSSIKKKLDFGWEIYLSLSILSVAVYVSSVMVDIADWMKQEIFVRLSHDYFTKCQILQPMSYR